MIRLTSKQARQYGLHSRGVTPKKCSAKARSASQEAFLLACYAHGLPRPVFEYRFHSRRRWKFDYAFLRAGLAVEKEGGSWIGGRHTSGKGFKNDIEKYNTAGIMGWLVLRFTPDQFNSGEAFDVIRQALESRKK